MSSARIRKEIADACLERGFNVRFVHGMFGGAGLASLGFLLRLLRMVWKIASKLFRRLRRRRAFEQSLELGWGVRFDYALVTRDPYPAEATPLFAAQLLELLACIEARLTALYGAHFAVESTVSIVADGQQATPVTWMWITPDSLRGASFESLYKLCKRRVATKKGHIVRSIWSDAPTLSAKSKAAHVSSELVYATSPKSARDQMPEGFWFVP